MNSSRRFKPGSPGNLLKVLAVTALAIGSTAVQADIKGSKHDLSTTGSAQQTSAATGEICVFCHTPHGSVTSAAVPLWNKTLPTTTYTRYSSLQTSSLDGQEAPVGSVSIACLSCHDGTQAMDVVINAPGSGGYVAGGSELDSGSVGKMLGTVGAPLSGRIPNLENDLSNDHPISIQYAGGGCDSGTPACNSLGDADFKSPSNALINGVRIWWVDTQNPSVREKEDMQLYSRTLTTAPGAALEPFVECGSCHDPHVKTSTPVSFLRINNTGSAVCLACHVK